MTVQVYCPSQVKAGSYIYQREYKKKRIVVYFRERSDRTVMDREENERKRRCM